MRKKEPIVIPYEFGLNIGDRKPFDENEIHKQKVQDLKSLAFAEELIDIFRHYVNNFIPTPRVLENEYWMCSCFPGNDPSPIRINIYWHEVFRIHESPLTFEDEIPAWDVMFFTDKTLLTNEEFDAITGLIHAVRIDEGLVYSKGLPEQQALLLPTSTYFQLMESPVIVESVKQYNHKLMHRGRRVHTGHNYYLAGLVL